MADIYQFIKLAESQKGRACAALINQVLNHKKIFTFGELLAIPSIASLKDSEFSKNFATLELFAYGTYSNYLENKESYLELTETQEKKLKQLTIVSIAQNQKIIYYSTLQSQLNFDNIRFLEDLIIESIYSGLLTGKLDQRQCLLKVNNVISRDLSLADLPALIQKLNIWKEKCSKARIMLENSNSLMQNSRSLTDSDIKAAQLIADKMANEVQAEVSASEGTTGGHGLNNRRKDQQLSSSAFGIFEALGFATSSSLYSSNKRSNNASAGGRDRGGQGGGYFG